MQVGPHLATLVFANSRSRQNLEQEMRTRYAKKDHKLYVQHYTLYTRICLQENLGVHLHTHYQRWIRPCR
jgi:hypothetical protein